MASIVKRKKKFSVVYSYTDEKGIEHRHPLIHVDHVDIDRMAENAMILHEVDHQAEIDKVAVKIFRMRGPRHGRVFPVPAQEEGFRHVPDPLR